MSNKSDTMPLIRGGEKREVYVDFYDRPHVTLRDDDGEDVHDRFLRKRHIQKISNRCKVIWIAGITLSLLVLVINLYYFVPHYINEGSNEEVSNSNDLDMFEIKPMTGGHTANGLEDTDRSTNNNEAVTDSDSSEESEENKNDLPEEAEHYQQLNNMLSDEDETVDKHDTDITDNSESINSENIQTEMADNYSETQQNEGLENKHINGIFDEQQDEIMDDSTEIKTDTDLQDSEKQFNSLFDEGTSEDDNGYSDDNTMDNVKDNNDQSDGVDYYKWTDTSIGNNDDGYNNDDVINSQYFSGLTEDEQMGNDTLEGQIYNPSQDNCMDCLIGYNPSLLDYTGEVLVKAMLDLLKDEGIETKCNAYCEDFQRSKEIKATVTTVEEK